MESSEVVRVSGLLGWVMLLPAEAAMVERARVIAIRGCGIMETRCFGFAWFEIGNGAETYLFAGAALFVAIVSRGKIC